MPDANKNHAGFFWLLANKNPICPLWDERRNIFCTWNMQCDKFVGLKIDDYRVESHLDAGKVGSVYLLRRDDPEDVRAVKFIPVTKLRPGWKNEITKVTKLGSTEGVVRYQRHSTVIVEGEEVLWIAWDFVEGCSLKKCIEGRTVTLPMLIDVIRRILGVLHACKAIGIQHGDLHSGNILVENENPRNIDRERRRIWVTDFGYCTASDGREMLDDFLGLRRIVSDALMSIDFHTLDASAKLTYRALKREFLRDLTEVECTEGEWVREPAKLLQKLDASLKAVHNPPQHSTRRLGDYLHAESIGDREADWRELFVPEFIGRSTLLERNICVLTGLRGCGKTMVFRRLTALFDARLGPSKVIGADQFIGFYVTARTVAEAFPWLPESMEQSARNPIISYFHLCWCQEIIDWLREIAKPEDPQNWITIFFKEIFGERLIITDNGPNSLFHLSTFLSKELEKCRLTSSYDSIESIQAFIDLTFLEKFCEVIRENLPQIGDRPFYFFLDDYSTPLVNSTMQRVLNAAIFRRSASVIFKVATESSESFEPVGLNGKALEEEHDYVLIDSSSYALTRPDEANSELLAAILKPRIDGDPIFTGRNLSLTAVLGNSLLRDNGIFFDL